MNAQKAIEIKEAALKNIKEVLDLIDNETIKTESSGLKHMRESYEALSIILESAKLFHEHTVPDRIRENVRFGRSEEYTTFYGVPLENVGIELDNEHLINDLRKKDKSDNHEADIQNIGEMAYRLGRADGYHEGVEAVKELFRK